jgi:hypothetical protein
MNELSPEALLQLKNELSQIGAYLPENKAPYIWDTFNHIRDEQEMRPCTCASAAGHWKRAIDFLHDYAKNR